jgi:hypothetical protein
VGADVFLVSVALYGKFYHSRQFLSKPAGRESNRGL